MRATTSGSSTTSSRVERELRDEGAPRVSASSRSTTSEGTAVGANLRTLRRFSSKVLNSMVSVLFYGFVHTNVAIFSVYLDIVRAPCRGPDARADNRKDPQRTPEEPKRSTGNARAGTGKARKENRRSPEGATRRPHPKHMQPWNRKASPLP